MTKRTRKKAPPRLVTPKKLVMPATFGFVSPYAEAECKQRIAAADNSPPLARAVGRAVTRAGRQIRDDQLFALLSGRDNDDVMALAIGMMRGVDGERTWVEGTVGVGLSNIPASLLVFVLINLMLLWAAALFALPFWLVPFFALSCCAAVIVYVRDARAQMRDRVRDVFGIPGTGPLPLEIAPYQFEPVQAKDELSPMNTFKNPILPGFYPDPSVVRVGEDYYLVTSTFEYFPGLPIFHSRDLVHWRQIGHVLDRPSQLNLDGIKPSAGLYAPTIRYHDGAFYVINTLVGDAAKLGGHAGNFIVTAAGPAGPWSEPYWLEDADGIDPSLLFDDDGRAWYTGTRGVAEPRYTGHCEIWLRELDLSTMKLTGPTHVLWDEGAMHGAIYAEAPHLYRIDGRYYLLIAEGGTAEHHAITIARSESVTGPYEPCPHNPLLTHRHLGPDAAITGTGHADLIQTQTGEWWAVMLAMRPYRYRHYNLGRETFLAPVTWFEGWPYISPETGKLEMQYPVPDLPEAPVDAPPARDDFDAPELGHQWMMLRTPRAAFYSLTERPGHLRLKLRPEQISAWTNPSFIGRRQQHGTFVARAVMDFTPASEAECAGLVLLQNNDFQFRFVVTLADGERVVQLIQREKGRDAVLAQSPAPASRIYFHVSGAGSAYSFFVAETANQWQTVAESVDGALLSTQAAGGFVGTVVGLYASSNGQASENVADWDWFEYSGKDAE